MKKPSLRKVACVQDIIRRIRFYEEEDALDIVEEVLDRIKKPVKYLSRKLSHKTDKELEDDLAFFETVIENEKDPYLRDQYIMISNAFFQEWQRRKSQDKI